jgi:hypothetical protein
MSRALFLPDVDKLTTTINKLLNPYSKAPPRPPAPQTDDPQLQWLIGLNHIFTYMKWVQRPRPNMIDPGGPDRIPCLEYTDMKIHEPDLRKILSIVKDKELPIEPMNQCMGFQIGYRVLMNDTTTPPGIPIEPQTLVQFVERQFPTKTIYKDVWKTVTRPRNRELLRFYGLGEVRERQSYDY